MKRLTQELIRRLERLERRAVRRRAPPGPKAIAMELCCINGQPSGLVELLNGRTARVLRRTVDGVEVGDLAFEQAVAAVLLESGY